MHSHIPPPVAPTAMPDPSVMSLPLQNGDDRNTDERDNRGKLPGARRVSFGRPPTVRAPMLRTAPYESVCAAWDHDPQGGPWRPAEPPAWPWQRPPGCRRISSRGRASWGHSCLPPMRPAPSSNLLGIRSLKSIRSREISLGSLQIAAAPS